MRKMSSHIWFLRRATNHWSGPRHRRRSINGVDFLVFRFCQTLPAVCPLVASLATVATLTFKLGGTALVSRALCLSLALALALTLIELGPSLRGRDVRTRSITLLCNCQQRQHPSVSHLHCWVPTPLLDHPCRRFGQTEETLTCSGAPLDTSHLLDLLPI